MSTRLGYGSKGVLASLKSLFWRLRTVTMATSATRAAPTRPTSTTRPVLMLEPAEDLVEISVEAPEVEDVVVVLGANVAVWAGVIAGLVVVGVAVVVAGAVVVELEPVVWL